MAVLVYRQVTDDECRVFALRRAGTTAEREDSTLVVGDLTIDEDSHDVSRDGQEIRLTATEFELLRYFMRNPKRVLSKAQILDRVWHYDFGGQANIVELYVSYLRRKIDTGRVPMIHTLRGVGYMLKPAESPTAQGWAAPRLLAPRRPPAAAAAAAGGRRGASSLGAAHHCAVGLSAGLSM